MSVCECLGEYPHPDYTTIEGRIICDGRGHMFAKQGALIKVAHNAICQNCGRYESARLISTLSAPGTFYISTHSGYFNLDTVPINADFQTIYTHTAARLEFVVIKYYGIMIQFNVDTLIYFDRLIVKSLGETFILVDDGRTVVGAFFTEEGQLIFINEFGGVEQFHALIRGPDGIFRNAQIEVNSALEAVIL